jgi:hypothetical protein
MLAVVWLEMTVRVSTERDREDAGVRFTMAGCAAMWLLFSRVDKVFFLFALETESIL